MEIALKTVARNIITASRNKATGFTFLVTHIYTLRESDAVH